MNSLINTSYPDFEIIVVDNASTDQSVPYLRERHKSIKVIEVGENRGFAEGSNVGASMATGTILAFLNNDMEVHSDWLTNAVTKLTSDSKAAVVQCKIMKYNNRGRIDCIGLSVDRFNLVHMIGQGEIDQGQYDNLPEIGACSGGAMVIWKHIFNEIGCFDNLYFMYYEDVDLSWRIKIKGFRILPAQASVVYHVGSATTQTSSSSGVTRLTPFFGFHTTKNYLYCWFKNASSQVLLVNWPVVLFIVSARISFELLNGKTSVALSQMKGTIWNLTNIKYILSQRKKIKDLRICELNNDVPKREIYGRSYLLTWIRHSIRMVKHKARSK